MEPEKGTTSDRFLLRVTVEADGAGFPFAIPTDVVNAIREGIKVGPSDGLITGKNSS